jgi:hypothetical protein
MGLFAVARLAERHRIRVRLRPAPPQGLSALVWLPDRVIERASRLGTETSSWSAQPLEVRARAAGAGETAALTSGGGGSVGLASDYGDGGYSDENGTGSAAARTASGWFRGGRDGTSQSLAGPADASFGEPAISDQTVSGLPVRVPRTNRPAGTGGGAPDNLSGLPSRTPGSHRAIGKGPGTAGGGKRLPQRSPEQARSRLSGFQRGTRRAEDQGGSGGQAPRAGEGTES